MCRSKSFSGAWAAAFLIIVCAVAGRAPGAVYTVIDLGPLSDPLFAQTMATVNSVNLSGVAALQNLVSGHYQAMIYNGTLTNLGTLGGTDSYAAGVNNSNIVCGTALNAGGSNRAYRWTPGGTNGAASNPQMFDLGTLAGLTDSEASDINVSGQIAGDCFNADASTVHSTRFNTNNTRTDIGALMPGQLPISFGYAGNVGGQVVGTAYDANYTTPQAYLYTNGPNIVLLGDLTSVNGGGAAEAYAISASGQVVGYAINNNSEYHAYRWTPGGTGGVPGNPRMVDLGTLGGSDSSAWGINSSNVIVGKATITGDVAEHAFIAVSNTMVDLNTQLDASSNSWILAKAEYINDAGMICGYGTNSGVRHGFILVLASTPSAPVITNQPVPLAVLAGTNATFTVVAGGTQPLKYQWWFNISNNLADATNSTLLISNAQATNAGNYTVVITNAYGGVTSAPVALTVNFPPGITNQPVPVTVPLGSNATFTVVAGGTAPLRYQWWFNTGTNLAGATNSTLVITSVQASNVGSYTVIVTNVFGSVTSSPAALTLTSNIPPSITNQPAGQTIFAGGNATFTVGASGATPLSYRWWLNGTGLAASATNTSFGIVDAQATNAGNYTVVVTNAYGSVTSSLAYLNLVFAPLITSLNLDDTNTILAFSTGTGATYYVESRTNIFLGSWLTAIPNVAGVGGTKTVTNAGGGTAGAQFYRVRVTVP